MQFGLIDMDSDHHKHKYDGVPCVKSSLRSNLCVRNVDSSRVISARGLGWATPRGVQQAHSDTLLLLHLETLSRTGRWQKLLGLTSVPLNLLIAEASRSPRHCMDSVNLRSNA